jgi:Pectinacetylesterase
MFCWDQTSCDLRYAGHPFYMSSLTWDDQLAQGGIFGTGPEGFGTSPWGTANRVYVKYCTSDLLSGNTPASNASFGYAFRGAHVAPAVITSLIATKGLGSRPGTRLLFGGCSAGAIGAMNNIEAVQQLLPPTVELRGFFDGAALLDIQPRGWGWSADLESLQSLMAEMLAVSSPSFPEYCGLNFQSDLWKCLIGQYRLPLITTMPYFSQMPQFDMVRDAAEEGSAL